MALQIRLLSQGVVIHNPPGPLVYYLEKTIHPILIAPKIARERGKFYMEDGDPYFYIDKVANDYYYHLKQLEAIKGVIELAQSRGQLGEVEYIKQPTSSGTDVKFKNYRFDLRVPENNQDIFDFYGFQNAVSDTACESDRYQTIFEIQTGRGKSLSRDMPVLTPTGWRKIGDLKVGDYVIGRNGKPTKVIGVYPQGELDIYNFQTCDQRSVEVCANHLWDSLNTTENPQWVVRSTEEIKRLIAKPEQRVYIPLCNEVEFAEQNTPLPLDPYVLGKTIGDGPFVKPTTHRDNSTPVSASEPEGEFIPAQYMTATVEERWQLVRGLMDTDGAVNKDGYLPGLGTTSVKLAKQVQELVRSLGGVAWITTIGECVEGRVVYVLFMRLPTISKPLNDNNLKVRVKSIEPAGKKDCVCIKVDAEDELFITKDYIVTHNTKTFQKVMVRHGKRTCIIVRPAYKMKWKKDCVDDETGLYEPGPRVRVVSGVDGIDAILHDGKTGDLDKKNISTIIIPTTSLKLWLEAHSKSFGANRINLWEFFDILGVGLVGYDEIHEHFHTVYLSGLILNPPKLVEMSATLKPSKSKEFIRQRYLERFPLKNRVDVPYIQVCQIGFFYYSINCRRMVNRTNAMLMYNHKTFEDYLYQHDMLDDYFDMVYDIMERGYFKTYQKGQRVLVFFSLIQTCTDFRDYLEKRMKEEGKPALEVNRYVGDDKYDDLMTSDIAVSTPGKAGTAVDLPGLVMAIVTTAIDDRQLNEQIAGRPRRVTQWEGVTPRVIFLHAREIKKHNTYLASRKTALTPVAKSLDIVHATYTVVGNEQENRFLSPTKSSAQNSTVVSMQKKTMDRYRKMEGKKDRFRKRKSKRSNRKRRR